MDGISGSGTGGGDMINERLPVGADMLPEEDVVDVAGGVSSCSSKTENTEMDGRGVIDGHGRSETGLLGALSWTTGTDNSFGMAGWIDDAGPCSVTSGVVVGRGFEVEEEVAEVLRLEPGGCPNYQ